MCDQTFSCRDGLPWAGRLAAARARFGQARLKPLLVQGPHFVGQSLLGRTSDQGLRALSSARTLKGSRMSPTRNRAGIHAAVPSDWREPNRR